jgi:hypothetical protein
MKQRYSHDYRFSAMDRDYNSLVTVEQIAEWSREEDRTKETIEQDDGTIKYYLRKK